ncbi:deleted in malignant brain tumors 1 protein-like [Actinia tenebrosa]|uniref:Deleted in malignant brain tumors 1 protein-like n=1 Tax=Actinia tenebrosa TaxID=6105 RepID=A0A6P8I4Q3_ACTTE|nr:deleted in malignant brain tumors 1 protein-like [Actinia tenebrosa]
MKFGVAILIGCVLLVKYHVNAETVFQTDNEESDKLENLDNAEEEEFVDDSAVPKEADFWNVISDVDDQKETENHNDFLGEQSEFNELFGSPKRGFRPFTSVAPTPTTTMAPATAIPMPTTVSPPGAPIRLVNGGAPNQGRVEIYHNGRWGTICDDSWGLDDANVVCRQLGLPPATSAPCCARFGRGREPTWMDDVHCTGSERSLSECRFRGWGIEDCSHSEDAGVVCGISGPVTPTPTSTPIVSSSVVCPFISCLNGGSPHCRNGQAFCYCFFGYYGPRCQYYRYTTTARPYTTWPWRPTSTWRPYTTWPWRPTTPWRPYTTRRPSRFDLRILLKILKGLTTLLDGIKDGIKAGISSNGIRQYKREVTSMLGQLELKAGAIKESNDPRKVILLKNVGHVREQAQILMKRLEEIPEENEIHE